MTISTGVTNGVDILGATEEKPKWMPTGRDLVYDLCIGFFFFGLGIMFDRRRKR